MGQCLIHRTGAAFKAFINVTATPSASVTITMGDVTQTLTATSGGLAAFTVKKKGTYTVTSTASGSQTANVTVAVNKQTYTANIVGRFTLTLTPQSINGRSAATVAVSRKSSAYAGATTGALSSGDYIYYGDVLTCTAGVTSTTIYNTATMTVGGTAQTSGYEHTVTGAVTVAATTTVKSWTLTISNQSINSKTATSISVTKSSSTYAGVGANAAVANGGTIYYGDVLTCTCAAANTTIYNTPTMTINSETKTSGSTHTVTGAVTVAATTTVKSFTMTISNKSINGNTAATISAKKTSSTNAGVGVNTTYTASATVYYGDVFTITVANANSTVYNAPTLTVGGASFTSGNSYTATAAFTAAANSSVKTLTLTVNAGANSTITLARTGSTYAGAGNNTNLITKTGASGTVSVYYGDTIKWTYSASTNYNISTHTIGGTARDSGYSWSATAAVTAATTASVIVYEYRIYVYIGSTIKCTYKFEYPATASTFANVVNDSTYKYRTAVVSYGGNYPKEWCMLLTNQSTADPTRMHVKTTTEKDQGSGTISALYATTSGTYLTTQSALKSRYIWSTYKSYTNTTY